MNIVERAIRNWRLTLSILAFLIVAGAMAYATIPKEAEPDVQATRYHGRRKTRDLQDAVAQRARCRGNPRAAGVGVVAQWHHPDGTRAPDEYCRVGSQRPSATDGTAQLQHVPRRARSDEHRLTGQNRVSKLD